MYIQKHSSSNIYNSFYASNITIKSSYFDSRIYANTCNLNMTYSVMLGEISGNGKFSTNVSANYNWWGVNKGPAIRYAKNDSKYWVVMTF